MHAQLLTSNFEKNSKRHFTNGYKPILETNNTE